MQGNGQITIKTPLTEDELRLSHMQGTEELGRLFQYRLVLYSRNPSIDIDGVIGRNATVELAIPDGGSRHFNGYITRFSLVEANRENSAVYEATMSPWLWFLTRTADCRIFQEKAVPDIVKEVFRDNGFSDFEDKLVRSYRQWECCTQYRESDFNFVSRLLEQEGIYYYFVHQDGAHRLVLADDYSSHTTIAGSPELSFHPQGDRQGGNAAHVWDWSVHREIQSGKYAHTDYDFKKPAVDLFASRVVQRNHPHAEGDVFDYPGEYDNTEDGLQYAAGRLESLQTAFEVASGATNSRNMAHGCLFTLSGHPRDDQNREYLVVRCNYELSWSDAGGDHAGRRPVYACDFQAIESKTAFRAERTTPQPIVQGPQTAVVVGPAGEEIYTDEFGRVKVHFHWDRYGEEDEQSSCWIRVAQTWAGSGWGVVFNPRIGEEVIVDFLEGDPDRPIITGRVYNAQNMPPYDLPVNKTWSGIRSRSSQGGSAENFNEIRMEDKKGSEEVYVQAERDYNQLIKHDRSETVGNDRSLEVGGDKNETVAGTKTLNVGENHAETVGSNMSLSIGNTLTKTVGANYSETVGAALELTVGTAMVETVGASRTQAVGVNNRVNVGKNAGTRVGKNSAERVGNNKTVRVGNNESVKVGKKLLVDAGDEITIKTGKASITMKKDGSIAVRGKDISIRGSGSINIKASKNLSIKGKKILDN